MGSVKRSSSQSIDAYDHDSNFQIEAQQQQLFHLVQAHSQALTAQIQGQQQIKKLKVEDALSYLDMVKLKFGNHPIYYNEFLDIMKDFKSQSIDTMAAISRISQLFRGHPELIKGFSRFLPPGYSLHFQTGVQFQPQAVDCHPGTFQSLHTNSKALNVLPLEEKNCEIVVAGARDCTIQSSQLSKSTSENINISNQVTETEGHQEANFAISYINKVKDRFQEQPNVYKQFVKILSSCVKAQKDKEGHQSSVQEVEIYAQVSKLFENHDDLIQEFEKFMPQAKDAANCLYPMESDSSSSSLSSTCDTLFSKRILPAEHLFTCKKPKISSVSDSSLASVGKYGSLNELGFFDRVKKALNYPDVYDNFLRCLVLYNDDIVSRTELMQLVISFLGKFPDLLKEFQDILGFHESGNNLETVPFKIVTQNKEKIEPDLAMDIDYSTGRRYGASYRALPKNFEQPKCSGRTALCREVLNDIWVSFPSWSEDSTFVSSCKTQYEEIIYRCEDERFELDMVLEANSSVIQALDNVQKKISKMTPEEKNSFFLDEMLGGTSAVLHERALKRVYGDKTEEVIQDLKSNPILAVPLVLKRLKAKEEEWKEAQKTFNVIWRDQNDSYYLKSLDHQGINFKQNDSKCLRSKSLLNEIETLYEEKREQIEEGSAGGFSGPHIILQYKELAVLEDAANLVSQHTKRQPGIHREDRRRIEHLLRHFIPDFFGIPRGVPVEDENEQDDVFPGEVEEIAKSSTGSESKSGETTPRDTASSPIEEGESDKEEKLPLNSKQSPDSSEKKLPVGKDGNNHSDKNTNVSSQHVHTELPYTVFFVNNNWYLFFRQHYTLCDRLAKLYHQSIFQKSAHMNNSEVNDSSVENDTLEKVIKDTYSELLEKVSNLLNGTVECSQYEDEVRDLFGIHAYMSFTMDKVVHNMVRQLQQIISDETCRQCTAFYVQHVREYASGATTCPWELSAVEAEYQKKVEQLISEDNCYKVIWYKKEHILTIELLDPEPETSEEPSEVERWSDYVDNYLQDDSMSEDMKEFIADSPVYLTRNLEKQKKMWKENLKIRSNLLETHLPTTNPNLQNVFQLGINSKRRRRKMEMTLENAEDDVISVEKNEMLPVRDKDLKMSKDSKSNHSGSKTKMRKGKKVNETQENKFQNETSYNRQISEKKSLQREASTKHHVEAAESHLVIDSLSDQTSESHTDSHIKKGTFDNQNKLNESDNNNNNKQTQLIYGAKHKQYIDQQYISGDSSNSNKKNVALALSKKNSGSLNRMEDFVSNSQYQQEVNVTANILIKQGNKGVIPDVYPEHKCKLTSDKNKLKTEDTGNCVKKNSCFQTGKSSTKNTESSVEKNSSMTIGTNGNARLNETERHNRKILPDAEVKRKVTVDRPFSGIAKMSSSYQIDNYKSNPITSLNDEWEINQSEKYIEGVQLGKQRKISTDQNKFVLDAEVPKSIKMCVDSKTHPQEQYENIPSDGKANETDEGSARLKNVSNSEEQGITLELKKTTDAFKNEYCKDNKLKLLPCKGTMFDQDMSNMESCVGLENYNEELHMLKDNSMTPLETSVSELFIKKTDADRCNNRSKINETIETSHSSTDSGEVQSCIIESIANHKIEERKSHDRELLEDSTEPSIEINTHCREFVTSADIDHSSINSQLESLEGSSTHDLQELGAGESAASPIPLGYYNGLELTFGNDLELPELEECRQIAMEGMDIIENTQCKFNGNSYKMIFVGHMGSYMYRRGSLTRAKMLHCHVSEKMSRRFRAWHKIWLDRYVTPGMLKACQDWLLKSDCNKSRTICITENNASKPPYGPYSRYRIQHYRMYI